MVRALIQIQEFIKVQKDCFKLRQVSLEMIMETVLSHMRAKGQKPTRPVNGQTGAHGPKTVSLVGKERREGQGIVSVLMEQLEIIAEVLLARQRRKMKNHVWNVYGVSGAAGQNPAQLAALEPKNAQETVNARHIKALKDAMENQEKSQKMWSFLSAQHPSLMKLKQPSHIKRNPRNTDIKSILFETVKRKCLSNQMKK